jgi:ComF family protein
VYNTTAATESPLKSALKRFKYDRDVSLAPVLGSLLVDHAPLVADDYDVLVPVPLHDGRLRWRGFNQALLLARALGKRSRVDPFALRRKRATTSQVGLSEAERGRNVRDAFVVDCPERVSGLSVLLVDDVYTTGATAESCAATLLDAGVSRVDVLVLARAVR